MVSFELARFGNSHASERQPFPQALNKAVRRVDRVEAQRRHDSSTTRRLGTPCEA